MNKKILTVVGITILFLGTCITPSVAIDNVKKSSIPISSGNTLYVGGIGEGNYTKIQDAIDNASIGDTVFVYNYSSPYYENLIINKSINLIGENRNTTIINKTSGPFIIIISAERVNISSFNILSNEENKYVKFAIDIRANYTTIKGITILNCYSGINTHRYELNSNNHHIVENIISNNYEGIRITDSVNNIISSNTIINCYEGINLWNSDYNIIRDNFLISNNYSITLLKGDSNNITRNNVLNNDEGIGIYSSNNNSIIGNNINSNNGTGL